MNTPKTLTEAIVYFNDPDNCLNYMVARRWPDGVKCPRCGSENVRFLAKRRIWECKAAHPKKQFSVKVGTVFEDSPIKLSKWLAAVWMIVNCKNGISSYEIHRALGVTQKTAWFMLHRIRLGMQARPFADSMSGEVEADESFIGGKARNMHASKRRERIQGRGPDGKAIVMGLLEPTSVWSPSTCFAIWTSKPFGTTTGGTWTTASALARRLRRSSASG